MAALNEADFADPTSLLAALGHSTRPEEQIWLDPSGRTSEDNLGHWIQTFDWTRNPLPRTLSKRA